MGADAESVESALAREDVQASAHPPLVTAPMAVERPADAAGGITALATATNEILRKVGLVRGARLLRRLNQPEGFDCPGCAWPDLDRNCDERAAYCEAGIRCVVDEIGPRRANPSLFETFTVRELAARSDHWLSARGRLTHPMILRPGRVGYEPCSWDEALELVAGALAELDTPDRAVFYSSGRVGNEAAFCLQLLARGFGTNNLPSSNDLCHRASERALAASLGDRAGAVTLADFDAAELIVVAGLNPGSNHPRMLGSLRRARQRGAKVLTLNPLLEPGLLAYRDPRSPVAWVGAPEPISDLHLRPRPGGDLAVFLAIAKQLCADGAVDEAFLAEHCSGFEELREQLASWSWAELVAAAGVAEDELRAAAELFAASERTLACWGLGLTQHPHAVDSVRALINLLLLRGDVGRAGSGPMPVLGHNNAAGCRRMGCDAELSAARLAQLGAALDFEPPTGPGLDLPGALEAMHAGRVDVLFGLGGNLLSASPDTDRVAAGLRRCKLTVHVATKLNRGHLITGETGLILPCLGRTELDEGPDGPRFVSVEDAEGRVHRSQGSRPPASDELRSESWIVARLAAALEDRRGAPLGPKVDWSQLAEDPEAVRRHIAASVPGCAELPTALRSLPGLDLFIAAPARARRFPTPTGKAALATPALPELALADDRLRMITLRSHDQHNSSIFGHDDRPRGIFGYRRVLLISLADLRRLDIEPYDQVDLTSHFDGETRTAARWVTVPFDIPVGVVASYFPEANALVPAGGIPRSKFVTVSLTRSESDEDGESSEDGESEDGESREDGESEDGEADPR